MPANGFHTNTQRFCASGKRFCISTALPGTVPGTGRCRFTSIGKANVECNDIDPTIAKCNDDDCDKNATMSICLFTVS